ncbi:hypothetical protein KUTeg_006126 [Tegillarca granosa]|uniref:Uncharacterized protein n=1 Tax=Tegillarca granosa TaxID=220873 RepID=A0ABQ9FHW2_TEGGR|nr:hypothetical protein KUTeg_006126 [Tegillarca granosa]
MILIFDYHNIAIRVVIYQIKRRMNLSPFSDSHSSRPTSFFIEDILLNKPKQMCRDSGPISSFVRPMLPEYNYPCLPGTHLIYPHQLLSHVQGFMPKHGDHPFLVPATVIALQRDSGGSAS